jgi:hypothetical protein
VIVRILGDSPNLVKESGKKICRGLIFRKIVLPLHPVLEQTATKSESSSKNILFFT